jgi:predicted DsbA family dithiol-disulfide isomerase
LQAVEEDNLRARLAGVYAVPTIIINNERILSGAHKYHTLKDYIKKSFDLK